MAVTLQVKRGLEANLPASAAAGEPVWTTDSHRFFIGTGSGLVEIGTFTGTVTSVGLAAPAIFSVSGSPVTTSGTLTLALATQAANLVWAGPAAGPGGGTPTFRALVAADVPDLSGTYLTVTAAAAAYQPKDATLTALAALTIAANTLTIGTGADAFSQTAFAANTFPARASTGNLVAKPVTDFGLSLMDDADAAAARATLGLGTAATSAAGDFQAADAQLTSLAGLSYAGAGGSVVAVAAAEDGFELVDLAGVYQPLSTNLLALAAHTTFGFVALTAASTFAGRAITGTAGQVTVTNGNGVAGDPAISLPADLLIPSVLTVPNTGLHLLDTNASHDLIVKPGSNLTADRTLTVTTGDADRTLTLSADATLSGTNTGDQTITLTGDVTGTGTGSFAATIGANKVTAAKLSASTTNVLFGRATAGAGGGEEIACTAAGRALLDDADATAQRTTLGLGTAATANTGTSGAAVPLLNGVNTWSAAQTFPNSSGVRLLDTDASHTLGLVLGSNLTAGRTLTVTPGDASRTLTLSADATLGGTNTGDVTLAGQTYLTIAGQVVTANAVNLSGTHVTGTLAAARMPALTGDVTTVAGAVATTLASVGTAGTYRQVTTDAKGRVTAGSNAAVSVRAYNSGTWTHNSSSSWLSAPLDSESWDSDGFHSTVTNTSRFTVPAGLGGKYTVTGTLVFATNATGLRGVRFLVNGTTEYGQQQAAANAGGLHKITTTALLELAAGDYVELQGIQNSGGSLTVGAADTSSTSFSAVYHGT